MNDSFGEQLLCCRRPSHRASAIAGASRRRFYVKYGGQRPPMPPSPLSRGGMKIAPAK